MFCVETENQSVVSKIKDIKDKQYHFSVLLEIHSALNYIQIVHTVNARGIKLEVV